MGDVRTVINATGTLFTGKGQVAGLVLTAGVGNPLVTIYDNTLAGGTKIFEAYASTGQPLVIFFADRYAPRFVIGCHIVLPANTTMVLWTRQL